jgi:hypothetical protein
MKKNRTWLMNGPTVKIWLRMPMRLLLPMDGSVGFYTHGWFFTVFLLGRIPPTHSFFTPIWPTNSGTLGKKQKHTPQHGDTPNNTEPEKTHPTTRGGARFSTLSKQIYSFWKRRALIGKLFVFQLFAYREYLIWWEISNCERGVIWSNPTVKKLV